MNRLFLSCVTFSLLITVSGCGTYHNGLYGTRAPGLTNDLPSPGIITGAGPFIYKESLIPKMQELCAGFGGLDFASIRQIPTPHGAVSLGDINPYYEYNCRGSPKTSTTTTAEEKPFIDKKIESTLVPPSKPSADLESVKNKCLELGFKDKTEAFGKCVLDLSR